MLYFVAGCLLLMFAYRLRGGGFYAFGNDTVPRMIWALCFQFAFPIPMVDFKTTVELGTLIGICMYIAISAVPHGFCQDMGRAGLYDKKWPAWFLPTLTQAQWTAMPFWQREAYDFLAMAGVALARAAIIFIPYGYFTNDLVHCLHAGLTIILLQPLGYWLGYRIPFTFPSLSKKSSDWGELFNGLGWALSLKALVV